MGLLIRREKSQSVCIGDRIVVEVLAVGHQTAIIWIAISGLHQSPRTVQKNETVLVSPPNVKVTFRGNHGRSANLDIVAPGFLIWRTEIGREAAQRMADRRVERPPQSAGGKQRSTEKS
jgi:sRNA-binding carbon storage regulator CsrA